MTLVLLTLLTCGSSVSERLCDEFFYLVQYACACTYNSSPVGNPYVCSGQLCAGNGVPRSANTTGKLVTRSRSGLCPASKLVNSCLNIWHAFPARVATSQRNRNNKQHACYGARISLYPSPVVYALHLSVSSGVFICQPLHMTHNDSAAHNSHSMACGQITRKGIAPANPAPGLRTAMISPQTCHQNVTALLTRTSSQT